MKKPSVIIILMALVLLSLGLARNVLADVPQVRNVIVWKDEGNTKLNVTVYHNAEVPGHYVDSLSVTVTSGTNITQSFNQSGPHVLGPDSTFNITLDIGPVVDTPLATVQARCNLHGWSSQNWTGVVPEYLWFVLLLTLSAAVSVILRRLKTGQKSACRFRCLAFASRPHILFLRFAFPRFRLFQALFFLCSLSAGPRWVL